MNSINNQCQVKKHYWLFQMVNLRLKNGSLERVKKELAAANCEYVLFNEVAANPH